MRIRQLISTKTLLVLTVGFIILAVVLSIATLAPASHKDKIIEIIKKRRIAIINIIKKDRITWGPSSVTEIIVPGETKTVPVSFTAPHRLRNVVVKVPLELQPFVEVEPPHFSRINKGETVNLDLIISASLDSLPDMVQGKVRLVIELRLRRRTIVLPIFLARPLPVTINIGELVDQEGGEVTSIDGKATLTIPQGAIIGEEPLIITVAPASAGDLPPPFWGEVTGPVYDFGPSGTVFAKPLTLSIEYDPLDIPLGFDESSLRIAREENGEWLGLDGFIIDPVAQTVSADVWHFTRFAIVAAADEIPPDPPTNVTSEVLPGDPGSVSISWINPTSDFGYAKIYRSSEFGVSGVSLDTEIKPVCNGEVGCNEGPPYIDTMTPGLNCYTVHALDPAGNETTNDDQVCEEGPGITVVSTDTPQNIPDPGQIMSVLTFPTDGTILDMTLFFQFTHECERNLVMDLTAPDGHTVRVMDRGLGRCSGIPTTFTSNNTILGQAQFFGGRQAAGNWTLTVSADNPFGGPTGFTGTLDTWRLSIQLQLPGSEPVQFLSFLEGDPGIPGDGVFVNAETVFPPVLFTLTEPIRLSDLANGFTYTVFFPAGSPSLRFVQLGIRILESDGPCSVFFTERPAPSGNVVFNGAPGVFTNVSASFLDGILSFLNSELPGCGFSLDDLYFNHLLLEVENPPPSFVTTLDAAAVGLGLNAFP